MTREHKGDYGYDGSFDTVSARAQIAGVGVGSAALLAAAGVALARGNRVAAAVAGASSTTCDCTAMKRCWTSDVVVAQCCSRRPSGYRRGVRSVSIFGMPTRRTTPS